LANSNPVAIEDLLALACKVLDPELTESKALTASFASYTTLFDEWFSYWNAKDIQKSGTQTQLAELVQKHEAILKRAQSVQASTEAGLSQLRKKGRGIKAYITAGFLGPVKRRGSRLG
jgi:hypothetical protein